MYGRIILALSLAAIGLGPSTARAFELAGTVKGAAGETVAGADVWVWQDREVRQTATDAEGRFRFADGGEGRVQVVARKDGHALGGADVFLGGPRTVELVLGVPVTLTLRVVDADYKPLPGATLLGMDVDRKYSVAAADLSEHGFPSLRSDDAGLLVLTQLPKGARIGFAIHHPGYADTRIPELPVEQRQQPIILYPGVSVHGRVQTTDGEPVARARVSIYQGGPSGFREAAQVLTDPEGFYRAVVVPGEYQILAYHPNYAKLPSQGLNAGEGDKERVVDLRLTKACPLSGRLVLPDEQPCAGATLRYLVDGHLYGEALTFDDGSFRTDVPAGDGFLQIDPPTGFTTEHIGNIAVHVDADARGDAGTIRLKVLPAVEGVIVDDQDQPQACVLISSININPALWTLTDAEGRFHIQLAYVPEEGRASFRAEHGLRFLRRNFDVDLQHPQGLRVALEAFTPDLEEPSPPAGGNDLSELIGMVAPEPEVDYWTGSTPFTLDQLRGKVIVLTLWGGFDEIGPSRDRMYELCALHALLKDTQDVFFFGVHDNGSEPAEIEEYVKAYGIQFPVARDVESIATFTKYGTRVIPQTVLIDKKGRVRYAQVDGRLLELIKSLRRE